MSLVTAAPALRPVLTVLALVGVGALWGLGAPLVRIARLDGISALTIVFTQSLIGVAAMAAILTLRGRIRLPRDRDSLALYLTVGLLGIVAPHLAGYWALGHIPAGIHAMLTSLVPMFALALALGLRIERFEPARGLGLALGAGAVALLVLPESALPDAVPVAFVLLSALAPLCYALESAYVAHVSRAQAGAMQALLGGSVVAVLVMAPITLLAGVPLLPNGSAVAIWAIVAAGLGGTLAYAGYVTLLRSAGSVFATQVAYLVTGWAMLGSFLFLGERHGPLVWLALGVLFSGLFLVQPRPRLPVSPPSG